MSFTSGVFVLSPDLVEDLVESSFFLSLPNKVLGSVALGGWDVAPKAGDAVAGEEGRDGGIGEPLLDSGEAADGADPEPDKDGG